MCQLLAFLEEPAKSHQSIDERTQWVSFFLWLKSVCKLDRGNCVMSNVDPGCSCRSADVTFLRFQEVLCSRLCSCSPEICWLQISTILFCFVGCYMDTFSLMFWKLHGCCAGIRCPHRPGLR